MSSVVASDAVCSERGHSHSVNQDFVVRAPDRGVYFVLDGHGPGAEDVLGDPAFQRGLVDVIGGRRESVASAIKSFDARLQVTDPQSMWDCGAAISGIHVTASAVTVFNAGDSKTVVADTSGRMVFVTRDHVPSDKDEYERIIAMGGSVEYIGVPRVGGKLALSRSIGDWALRSEGVVCDPDTKKLVARPSAAAAGYVVLMTDGCWNLGAFDDTWNVVRHVLVAAQPQTPRDLARAERDILAALPTTRDDRSLAVLYFPRTRFSGR
jgi:serine/threonine protein phosphatase PrpC